MAKRKSEHSNQTSKTRESQNMSYCRVFLRVYRSPYKSERVRIASAELRLAEQITRIMWVRVRESSTERTETETIIIYQKQIEKINK